MPHLARRENVCWDATPIFRGYFVGWDSILSDVVKELLLMPLLREFHSGLA